jgi:single-strand DNA-binding protein
MNTIKNRVQLIGNLGGSPEVKTLESGSKVARFAVATSNYYTNKNGERVTETQWHNIVMWGKLASIAAKALQKGSQVAIDGKLCTRNYEDKEGTKKTFTEIVASNLLLITRKN